MEIYILTPSRLDMMGKYIDHHIRVFKEQKNAEKALLEWEKQGEIYSGRIEEMTMEDA